MAGLGTTYWLGGHEQPVPAATYTASSSIAALVGYGPANTIRAQLNVTAASGTSPTLNVVIEDTLDGVNWNTVGTFTQATAVGLQTINVTTPFSDTLRVRWTIAGTTPSFTFAVDWTVQA